MLCRSWRNGIGGTFGGGLGTKKDPNEAVNLAPVNVSFCVQPHGKIQDRVPHSIEILMPRSCGLLNPARIQLIWLIDGRSSQSLQCCGFKVCIYTINTAVMSYLHA